MAVPVVSPVLKKLFGTRNERLVKRYLRIVDQVNAHEEATRRLTDAQLREKTGEFRRRIADGASARDLMPEIFAVAREVMDRAVGIRNIFSPEHRFDPAVLPAHLQPVYAQVKAAMDAAPPRDPVDDLRGGNGPIAGWQYVDIPNELYEAVRELYPKSRPPFRSRPFDVQIIGGVVLSEGRIAEMKTGEGKTIVAPLAAYLACCEGKHVHVVTVNDYLVQRDRDWTFPFFRALGLTVGAIHPMHMQPPPLKLEAYGCDVVYGTTAEFGFDFLRDNMKLSVAEQVQKHREFAIVDEVDSILIDEARTPLIISGPAHQHQPRYDLADRLARHLVELQKPWAEADQKVQSCLLEISGCEGDIRNARDRDRIPELKSRLDAAREKLPRLEGERDRFTRYYEVELDKKKATLTHEGIEEAQRRSNVGSFYVGDNIDLPHLLEQAIRAHSVYQRDRDYVVAPDETGTMSIVIVDQNTGRKMVGRQWSDGLHQAIEAKEGVPIKQETQTMATITIQNFFKLYDRIAGMTGTADTEATEFHEIYKLDVVVIPTNVPVARRDYNDLVFLSARDKWDAIVDEIKRFHDVGRPVLVGTTSVEKSETLSSLLTKQHNIRHEVLNAKQHDREAEIIAGAGELGAVMIATNMAGRGTDIKLGRFTREALIDHWKRRSLAPREVDAGWEDARIIAAVYRHIAPDELGRKKQELQDVSDDELRLMLLRHWAVNLGQVTESRASSMGEEALRETLDRSGAIVLHRLHMFSDIEDLGGLHVVGTERHESRRIDNQLRGRSGRQGDNGSSRFFLSLEDDLMKMFAGPATMKILSRLGMKEGDAIEHPMLTKSVGNAQRKVEERNFLIRKNILEYDEVMDHQRHTFYGMRQRVLEGREVKELIFEHLENSVADAVETYLDPLHRAKCITEWVRENLGAMIDPDRIAKKDPEDLRSFLRIAAKEEAASLIRTTMGEFMPDDGDPSEWDHQSLVEWLGANFSGSLRISDIQGLGRREIFERAEAVAADHIDRADLAPIDQYLVPEYSERELASWVRNRFGVEIPAAEFVDLEDSSIAFEKVMDKAREVYARREMVYPIEFAMDMTVAGMQQDPRQALEMFCNWVRTRFELAWTPEALPSPNPQALYELLVEERKRWDDARIADRARRAVEAGGRDLTSIEPWLAEHWATRLTEDETEAFARDPVGTLDRKIRMMLRAELTQFERWVLLQIVDQAWKDHLYAMDQLRESIGFRSFSQRDPRIEFKREGARLFDDMQESIRTKVTDLVLKAKLAPQVAQRPQAPQAGAEASAEAAAGQGAAGAPGPRQVAPAQPSIAAAAAAAAGTASQRRDLEAAERAGVPAGARPARQPARAVVTVGRNEPCPCGSGLKYKKCCGK